MSTSVRVVPPASPEVTALANTCKALAEQSALDRFELAVKGRVQIGIRDDNDLRQTDELLHQVVLGADDLEAATKPTISEAFARHKLMIATVKPFKDRWDGMRTNLTNIILKYKRDKEELARRQQAELDRAAEDERRRKEAEARAALRAGDVATAKAAMLDAQSIVAPVLAASSPVLDNSKDRQVWVVSITDPEAVVKGIAAGIIPLSIIKEFDLGFLKREATKRGGLPATWVGCTAKQEGAISVRR